MRGWTSTRILALLLISAATSVNRGAAADFLEPCEVPGVEGEALCGTYEVFENRQTAAGRKIGLKVVVLPATGEGGAKDAITFFAGGPGDTSTRSAAGLRIGFPRAHATRDIVVVDFRGTGGSNPLRCPFQDLERGFLDGFLPPDGVRECREFWQEKADLDQYVTTNAIDDIDEVRQALGYERLNLIGVSYGTRAALVYMRRHPERVRTALLYGPAPTGIRMPLTFAEDAQTALDGWFIECANDPVCHAAFPELRAEFWGVVEKLREEAVAVQVTDPGSGENREVVLTKDAFAQTLRYMMYVSGPALDIPLFVHSAAGGNFTPIAEMALFFGGALGGSSDGYYLTVTCAEDLPFLDIEEAVRRTRHTFLGDHRAVQQKEACAIWGENPVAPAYLEMVSSDVPTLVVVGERDPVTPPRWAHEVVSHLDNSRLLVVPDGGHDFAGLDGLDCLDALAEDLVLAGSIVDLDTASCISAVARPPFPLELTVDVEIELTFAQLEEYAGNWVMVDQPMSLSLTLEEGSLRLHFPGQPSFRLAPLGEDRFKIDGLPGGGYVSFERDGSSLAGMEVDPGSLGPPIRFRREG